MSGLAERLERLGLAEYADRLALEGFDTWETVLDITESDLSTLGFKLGHRRKLQRAIAEFRGQPLDRALLLEHGKVAAQDGYQSDGSMQDAKDNSVQGTPTVLQSTGQPTAGTKRKYRRHPKTLKQADENAPERPPSAYVIFSNQIREELKGQDLSFTEIAKLVGERWQVLDPSVREAFESQAAAAKERYYAQMAEYKKTQQYQDYQSYLADFKAKHATPRADGKRSKIRQDGTLDGLTKTTSSENRRGSLVEAATVGHFRTRSNPSNMQSLYGGYGPPSETTSPNVRSIGLQSPVTQHEFSPRSSPPPSAPVYSTSYDLPHHARGTQSTAEVHSKSIDYINTQHKYSGRHWQRSPIEETPNQTPTGSEFDTRRTSRSLGALPSLTHQDTSLSSHGDTLTPPLPYQVHILPPLDSSKADRILPTPLPSITPALTASPLDMRLQNHSSPMPKPIIRATPTTQTGHFDALLRASELARDADLKDEATRRGTGSSR